MISAIIRVYNDAWHIYNCINNIYHALDEIVVIEGRSQDMLAPGIPMYDNPRSSDGTLEIIQDFITTKDIKKKIKLVLADGSRTLGAAVNEFWPVTSVKEGDFVIIVDADEIYCPKDATKIRNFVTSSPHTNRLACFAYNLIDIDLYRSDSFNGPIGIGGKVTKFGQFYTDRFTNDIGEPVTIPDITCFHYSLYKPLHKLQHKIITRPEVKDYWILKNNKPCFIDGTEIHTYVGQLPPGYIRK